jgi:hypothetical protein
MRLIGYVAAGTMAAILATQPCAAADDYLPSRSGEARMTAFAGLSVRLPLGGTARPSARLRFATGYSFRDSASGAVRTDLGSGLEIGAGKRGMPTYFIGGEKASALRDKLGIKGGSGKTLLIVGGVLVAVVIVAVAAGGAGLGDTCPTVGGDRSHCINP